MNSRKVALVAVGLVFFLCVNRLLASVPEDNSFDMPTLIRHLRGTRHHHGHYKGNAHDDETHEDESSIDVSNRNPSSSWRTTTEDPETEEEDDEMMPTHGHGSSRKPLKKKVNTRIIFEEQFTHRNWTAQWAYPKNPENGTKKYNKFTRVNVRKSNHSRPNYGLITSNKGGEFYMIATNFPPFNNRNETLVLQFSVQFQAKAHCQLAFLRLYDCQFSTEDFNIETPYIMQIGPHLCATSRENRVSAEFQEPGRNSIKPVDKDIEPVNNTSVNLYALALEPDGTYHIIINANATQNGTLKDEFQNYKGYTSICAVGIAVWHSVLDKFFKGQVIVDDVLVVNDMDYAEEQRKQILNLYSA